jgi:cytoskeletal protein CcmA (bactofilin family)
MSARRVWAVGRRWGVDMVKRDESVKPPDFRRDVPTEAAVNRGPAEKLVIDLGKSLVIKGDLSASEDLTLYGQMEGTITLPDHTLSVGPHAHISASIAAKAMVVMGAVTGNVTAGDRLEIRATGSVTGDITSPCLVVVEGGRLKGKVEMLPANSPSTDQ